MNHKIQSFRGIETLKPVANTSVDETPKVNFLTRIKTEIAQLQSSEISELLEPYLEKERGAMKVKIESDLQKQNVDYLEHEREKIQLQEKQLLEQEKDRALSQLNEMILAMDVPDIIEPETDHEKVLTSALLIVEKIVGHQVSSIKTYEQWTKNILSSQQRHKASSLIINQHEYDNLKEFDLLTELESKVKNIVVGDVSRFSFKLESESGTSGHDARVVLKHLEDFLNGIES